MTSKSLLSISNLVNDATKTENCSANKSRDWPCEEGKRESDDDLETVFNEVVNASVATIVETKITIFMKNDGTTLVGVFSSHPINKHIGTKISLVHD